MAHQALYRKYRPLTFDDVVEQQHVVNTLKNIVISGNTAHAYLFSGTRGTGKTTMAKIFARAVNCLEPVGGNPCNKCAICKGILDGTILDVIEIDAASNNSVDNVRVIIDEVVYSPTHARKKVYIIDEVHMLSTGAFNALLKTLEEPPEHVMFILATTEPHKLPATVLSRCQRFDFRRISIDGIVERLGRIAEEAGAEFTSDALRFIASISDGALRDGISILDQCIATGKNPLDLEAVHEIIGVAPNKLILDTANFLIDRNGKAAVEAIDCLISAGKDPAQFLHGMIRLFRDILVFMAGSSMESLLSQSAEDRARIPVLAGKISMPEVLAMVRELSELESGIRWSTSPRILLEITFLRICSREMSRDGDSLSEKIRLLEERIRRLEKGIVSAGNIDPGSESKAGRTEPSLRKSTSQPVIREHDLNDKEAKSAVDSDAKPFDGWATVLEELRKNRHMVVFSNLVDSTAVWKDDSTLLIHLPEDDLYRRQLLSKSENMEMLRNTIQECTGMDLNVELPKVEKKESAAIKDKVPEKVRQFAEKTGLPLDIVDE